MESHAKMLVRAVTTTKQREAVRRVGVSLFARLLEIFKKKRNSIGEPGVNLLGYVQGDFGLGESCRLLAGSLQMSEVPFSIYPISTGDAAQCTNLDWRAYESDTLPYGINLFHLNPDSLASTVWKLGTRSFLQGYNIGFFLWEQPVWPKNWRYALHLMDEIWTPAEFISQSVRKCTNKPVLTMPYGLPVPKTAEAYNRAYFGLPEQVCLFMISYDGYSNSDRKNPMGSVRAYCSAFSPDDVGVGLVIKATHAREEDLAAFHKCLKDYPNIYVLTENYSKVAFNSLIQCVDVYVSLHRAEGFGLVMAEAMQLGTAVIATNWSANTEFMNEKVACLVPAQVIELTQDSPPYPKGTHWAQPDEACAAQWMWRLYEDELYRKELCDRAKSFLREELSQEKAAQRIRLRLEELCSKGNMQT